MDHDLRLKLDRRIRNQRRALRENWMIQEQRIGAKRAYPHAHRYLGKIVELLAENRELKAKLNLATLDPTQP